MDWELKQELRQQLSEEQGYYRYPPGTRTKFALAYPNSYFVGMSNLGLHIIYELLNKRNDTACERVFLPERKSIERYENTRTPLMSVVATAPQPTIMMPNLPSAGFTLVCFISGMFCFRF